MSLGYDRSLDVVSFPRSSVETQERKNTSWRSSIHESQSPCKVGDGIQNQFLLNLNAYLSESLFHVGKVTLGRADPTEFGLIDVLHDLALLA